MMEIIPAIDIRGGRCVRLYQGDYDRETVFADGPVEVARHWAGLGAPRLHVVDLDGAREGVPVNAAIIYNIIDSAGVPVQVGGGIRSLAVIEQYLEAGAQRVVVGTAAVNDEGLLAEACRIYPEQVVVALDARNGVVMTEGWRQTSRQRVTVLARRMAALGVPRVLYTDVTRDGTLTEPNFRAIQSLVRRLEIPIIASGGVASVAHLQRLAALGVEGAIVGRALYTGDLSLKEALAALVGEAAPDADSSRTFGRG